MKHSRDEILRAAVTVAEEDGLASLGFGSVARSLGIADRTVVYYFPTKAVLLDAVLQDLTVRVQQLLAPALTQVVPDHRALAARAWAVLRRPQAAPACRLFLEALGLAASGREPFASVVPAFTEGWVLWVAEYLTGTAAQRRSQALAALALVDALLLLQHTSGTATARAAARALLPEPG